MLDLVRGNPKASQQVLLLAHLYARTDTNALAWLRSALVKPRCGVTVNTWGVWGVGGWQPLWACGVHRQPTHSMQAAGAGACVAVAWLHCVHTLKQK
jgi:hypothetical protein